MENKTIEEFMLLAGTLILFVVILDTIRNATRKTKLLTETPFDRAHKKAEEYSKTHRAGARVTAQSKDGSWKEGVVVGEHDWHLFTFFFTIKFDDGEFIKQEERKVTKI